MHHSTSEFSGSLWFLPLRFPVLCTTVPVSCLVHYDCYLLDFQFYAPQHQWVVWFTMILTSSISSSMHHSTSELSGSLWFLPLLSPALCTTASVSMILTSSISSSKHHSTSELVGSLWFLPLLFPALCTTAPVSMILTSSISTSMHHSTSELDGSLWFLPLLSPALCTTAPVSCLVHYDSYLFYLQLYAPQHQWVGWFTMILTSSISSSMHHSTSELDGSLWFLPLLFPALCITAPVSWMVHYDSYLFYLQF